MRTSLKLSSVHITDPIIVSYSLLNYALLVVQNGRFLYAFFNQNFQAIITRRSMNPINKVFPRFMLLFVVYLPARVIKCIWKYQHRYRNRPRCLGKHRCLFCMPWLDVHFAMVQYAIVQTKRPAWSSYLSLGFSMCLSNPYKISS